MRCSRAGHPEMLLKLSWRSAPSNWMGEGHIAPMRRGRRHTWRPRDSARGSQVQAQTVAEFLYLALKIRETLALCAIEASLSTST